MLSSETTSAPRYRNQTKTARPGNNKKQQQLLAGLPTSELRGGPSQFALRFDKNLRKLVFGTHVNDHDGLQYTVSGATTSKVNNEDKPAAPTQPREVHFEPRARDETCADTRPRRSAHENVAHNDERKRIKP